MISITIYSCSVVWAILLGLAVEYRTLPFYLAFVPVNIIQVSSPYVELFTIRLPYWSLFSKISEKKDFFVCRSSDSCLCVVALAGTGFFIVILILLGYVEFPIVWKMDFGHDTLWTVLYIPLYLLLLIFIVVWVFFFEYAPLNQGYRLRNTSYSDTRPLLVFSYEELETLKNAYAQAQLYEKSKRLDV